MSLPGREYIQIKRYHSDHASKKDIEEIIESCRLLFNAEFDGDFLNVQNLKMRYVSSAGQELQDLFPNLRTHYPVLLT